MPSEVVFFVVSPSASQALLSCAGHHLAHDSHTLEEEAAGFTLNNLF